MWIDALLVYTVWIDSLLVYTVWIESLLVNKVWIDSLLVRTFSGHLLGYSFTHSGTGLAGTNKNSAGL